MYPLEDQKECEKASQPPGGLIKKNKLLCKWSLIQRLIFFQNNSNIRFVWQK